MRWIVPAAVAATGLGVLMIYLPPMGKSAALMVSPWTPIALILAGTIGLAVGVARMLWPGSIQVGAISAGTSAERQSAAARVGGRVIDATALAGLGAALVALLALSSIFIVEPIVISLQGPDPCGPSTFLPDHQPDLTCFSAHPDYYQLDPGTGSWSTPRSRLSRTLEPVAWPAALVLALVAALTSWLALVLGTANRRTALSALALGSLIVLGMLVPLLLFVLGGGGD